LGIGDWPIPNPQSPIPNPQLTIKNSLEFIFYIKNYFKKKEIKLNQSNFNIIKSNLIYN